MAESVSIASQVNDDLSTLGPIGPLFRMNGRAVA